jgi:hypothetical protein
MTEMRDGRVAYAKDDNTYMLRGVKYRVVKQDLQPSSGEKTSHVALKVLRDADGVEVGGIDVFLAEDGSEVTRWHDVSSDSTLSFEDSQHIYRCWKTERERSLATQTA